MAATVSEGNRLSNVELDSLFGVTEPILSLQLQGNTFPRWSDAKAFKDSEPIRIKVENETEKVALSQRLESALWKSMPLASVETDSEVTLEEVIQAYTSNWKRLHQLHDELRKLVRSICFANVEWKSETDTQVPQAKQSLIESTVDEMAARVTQSFGPSSSILTAELTTLPLEIVRQRLTQSVRKELQQFCSLVETSLKNMAELQLIGILQWVGPNACKYHFFTEVLCHDGTTQEDSGLRFRTPSWQERLKRHPILPAYIATTSTALISQRRARHEHNVMHAFHTTLANSTVKALPRHRQLMDAIPAWLREFVRVIDGTLIREMVVEQEYCRKTLSEVKIKDMPQFDSEPAIVIDHFALTGWGPREIKQEEQRQVEQRVAASKASSDSEWQWWLTGVFPIALAFIGTAGFRPDLWPLAILALTACLFAVIQVVAMLKRAGKETGDVFQYVTSLLTTLTVCGAGALLISCFRGPVGTTPWWFLVCCLLAVCGGIGMFSAFETLKSLSQSASSSSRS